MTQLDEIKRAAVVLHDWQEYIGVADHIDIGAGGTETTAGIHGASPGTLLELADEFATATNATIHTDADDIIRWVSITYDDVAITWFRR